MQTFCTCWGMDCIQHTSSKSLEFLSIAKRQTKQSPSDMCNCAKWSNSAAKWISVLSQMPMVIWDISIVYAWELFNIYIYTVCSIYIVYIYIIISYLFTQTVPVNMGLETPENANGSLSDWHDFMCPNGLHQRSDGGALSRIPWIL